MLPDSSMAEVSKTERLDMVTLERVFADPRLPDEARALRTLAFFNQRFWLATRYYTTGHYADGLRNLQEALRLRGLLLKPVSLVELFHSAGTDLRIDDPVKLVHDVFDHLPPELEAELKFHKHAVLSRVHFCVALQKQAQGEVSEAKEHFARAFSIDPAFLEKSDEIGALICERALRLCVRPRAFVLQVLRNLPPEARPLMRLRRRALGRTFLTAAVRDYDADHWRSASIKALIAGWYRPRSLATRRGLGLLLRSLIRTAFPEAIVQATLSIARGRKIVQWRPSKQNLSFR
jgi:hypothetical protein